MTDSTLSSPPTPVTGTGGRPRWVVVAGAVVVVLVVAAVVWLVVRDGDDAPRAEDQAAEAITAGLALQEQGDLEGAYAKYTEALEHDPDNAFALYDLAVIDYLQSNPGLAEKRYRQALEIEPDFQPAVYNLAIVEQSLGKDRYALSLYQRAVQLDPSDANAHFNLALMLRASGYPDEGDAQMQIALDLNPELKDPGLPKGGGKSGGTPQPGASPTG